MKTDGEIGNRIRQVRQAKNLTQGQFADQLGSVTRGAVGNWERGQGIKRDNLLVIAATFGVNFEWLGTGLGNMAASGSPSAQPNAIMGDKLNSAGRMIPLYGQAVGGQDGEFVLNGNKLADIVAPPSLKPEKGAYAVTVAGESMEPRYFDGEVVFVDPEKRVRKGDFVVAQIHLDEHKPPLAYVKRLVRWNQNELVLSQFNPTKELRFEGKDVASVHFIVMGGVG